MGSTCKQGSALDQAELSTAEIPWEGNQKRKAILAGEVEKEIRKGLFLTLSFKSGGREKFLNLSILPLLPLAHRETSLPVVPRDPCTLDGDKCKETAWYAEVLVSCGTGSD